MQERQCQCKEECQLAVLYDGVKELSLLDRLRYISLRLESALRRRLKKRRSEPGFAVEEPALFDLAETDGIGLEVSDEPKEKGYSSLKAGDLVEILPLEEIKKTFDETGCCEGLAFLLPMEKFCGKRARVLKKVRTIFDERQRRMVRIRNCYILENAICDGRDYYTREGCDRSCYLFWKEKWLRKVEN